MATSYANKGGSGCRCIIPSRSDGIQTAHLITFLTDGNPDSGGWWVNGADVTDKWIKFDFGAGVDKRVYQAVYKQNIASSVGTWKWQASNNDSDWVDISSTFVLGSVTPQTFDLSSNTNEYRYYRILGVSGTVVGSPFWQEMTFSFTDIHGTGDVIVTTYDNSSKIIHDPIPDIFDGSYADSIYFLLSTDVTGKFVIFDFGEDASKVIDEVKFYFNRIASNGTWKFQGSNNKSDWTDIGDTFEISTAYTQTVSLSGNTTGYRYYKLLGVSGTTYSVATFVREIEFKIDDYSPTNIKKYNNVAYADIKSVQGVAKANIKKVQGVE